MTPSASDVFNMFIEPAIVPALLFIIVSAIGKYGRERYGDEAILLRNNGQGWAIFLAVWEYLARWHVQIAAAWMNHPKLTSGVFLILAPILWVTRAGIRGQKFIEENALDVKNLDI